MLEQDFDAAIECIVVVDGGGEVDLPDAVTAATGPSRTLRQMPNVLTPGPSGARNTGVQAAAHALVAFCDDDDRWVRSKLRQQVEVLANDPAAAVVTSGVTFRVGRRAFVRLPPAERVSARHLGRGRRSEVHTSTLLVRRELLMGEVGLFDETIPFGYGEDYDWVLRAAQRDPLRAVLSPLVDVCRSGSYFAGQWTRVIPALSYQLEHTPRFADRRNRARVRGRLAFARAAVGDRSGACRDAMRSLRDSPVEMRGYLALLVACGLPATAVAAVGVRFGRSV